MNILWFLLTWAQSDRWLEQMRRGQLTPAERAQDDLREAKEEIEEQKREWEFIIVLLIGALIIFTVWGFAALMGVHQS